MAIPAKDSFERFGDDLTEVLLDYLQFDDKFRYECTSRQWQRLVYNKVNTVEVVAHEKQFKRINDKSFDLSKWQTIFKKCRNVTKVLLEIDYIIDRGADGEEITQEVVLTDSDADKSSENEDVIYDDMSDDNKKVLKKQLIKDIRDKFYDQIIELVNKMKDQIVNNTDNSQMIINDVVEQLIHTLVIDLIDDKFGDNEVSNDSVITDNSDGDYDYDESFDSYETQPEVRDRVVQIYEQLTDLVVKECLYLTRFTSSAPRISNDVVIALIGRFGRQLKTLQFPRLIEQCLQITLSLSLMPNLRVVDETIAIDGLISSIDDNETNLIPKRLKIFDYYCFDNNVDKFAKFAEICCKKQIPLINMCLEIEYKLIDKVISCLKCFASLTDINICVTKRHINKQQFQQLVVNCPKLKRFAYKFLADYPMVVNYKTVVSDINEVFGETQVSALSLTFIANDINFVMTSDMLNRCRQLTRLAIYCHTIIREPFFVNLAVNLPKLSDLILGYVELTDQSLESLSKLKQLVTFTVNQLGNCEYNELDLMYLKMRPKFRQFTVTHRCIYSQID
ncbi:uncharacterized protein LOC128966223 [Oppia nitens]|uniref:uncharacterized protein LOC128966223 n=1 Tax=Oppia nitens TaxID=1686743 RepID=UPI0023DC25C1|nr:uncharacterized protein LOC128966223 [Oppia nitens]XP_054169048.1 uncharacterized protein LOC128966223 [Oppia nitens]